MLPHLVFVTWYLERPRRRGIPRPDLVSGESWQLKNCSRIKFDDHDAQLANHASDGFLTPSRPPSQATLSPSLPPSLPPSLLLSYLLPHPLSLCSTLSSSLPPPLSPSLPPSLPISLLPSLLAPEYTVRGPGCRLLQGAGMPPVAEADPVREPCTSDWSCDFAGSEVARERERARARATLLENKGPRVLPVSHFCLLRARARALSACVASCLSFLRTCVHARTPVRTHARTHTPTHTHAHTHTLSLSLPRILFSLPLPPSFLPSLPRSRARWHTHTDTQTHDTRRAHLGAKADVEHGVLT